MKVIDLDELFKAWAWNQYELTNRGFLSKLFNPKLKYKNASITVNYDHVKITPLPPIYEEVTDNRSTTKVVMETEYENDTENDQTHSFKTYRDTVSTAAFTLRKGYSKSVNVGLEVNLPEDMVDNGHAQNGQNSPNLRKQMATASFGNTLHLDTEEGNTVQKKIQWGVDTTITSMSGRKTIARLEVEENNLTYMFDLKVKYRGRIVVQIHDKRGDRKLVHTVEGDIATVLNDLKLKGYVKTNDFTFDMERRDAYLQVEGSVIFKYGVKEKVKVAYDEPRSRDGQPRQVSSVYPNLPGTPS